MVAKTILLIFLGASFSFKLRSHQTKGNPKNKKNPNSFEQRTRHFIHSVRRTVSEKGKTRKLGKEEKRRKRKMGACFSQPGEELPTLSDDEIKQLRDKGCVPCVATPSVDFEGKNQL